MTQQLLSILKKYWGFETFRSLQQEIVESVLGGHDTLALLPTGGGKSLCYQLPAVYREGLCLVISPLIALMKDQVDQLNGIGIRSHAIYTGLTNREIDIILDNCIYGSVKLLYISPERLQTEIFVERAKKMNVNLLAIDESHCISQWGYDFRPSYLQIADFQAEVLPGVTTIALTATATEKVVEDICEKLKFENHNIFKGSFERKNLAFAVRQVEQKESKLLEVLTNVKGSALVYVRHRKRTKEIVDFLNRNSISSDLYHAGIGHEQRMKKQDSWKSGQTRVIVATNAFGMGIDKGDVRVVVHYDVPDSLEAYYQEAGRAGRDGKKAFAVIIYQKGDRHLMNTYFENAHPGIDFLKHIYQALANYYKIAVGSNKLSYFDFDLNDFCNSFNLHSSEAYHAIRKLEEEGFLELNESFYHPSKISVNLDKAELYKFQIANATLDPLIKVLLRLYGGELLGNFVKISEYQVARLLNTTTFKVKSQLDHLNTLKVITYDRMRDKPQLAFITGRYDASKLPLNRERLNRRKIIQKEKLDAILNYVEMNNRCRTAAILHYFGEHQYEDCGHCDYCLEKKQKLSKSDHERIREMVHFELSKGPRLPEEITKIFGHNELTMVEDIIRELTENDDLKYDVAGRLVWKSK